MYASRWDDGFEMQVPKGMRRGAAMVTYGIGLVDAAVRFPARPQHAAQWQ